MRNPRNRKSANARRVVVAGSDATLAGLDRLHEWAELEGREVVATYSWPQPLANRVLLAEANEVTEAVQRAVSETADLWLPRPLTDLAGLHQIIVIGDALKYRGQSLLVGAKLESYAPREASKDQYVWVEDAAAVNRRAHTEAERICSEVHALNAALAASQIVDSLIDECYGFVPESQPKAAAARGMGEGTRKWTRHIRTRRVFAQLGEACAQTGKRAQIALDRFTVASGLMSLRGGLR